MQNSFMKKCSHCGKLGAAFQTTDDDGETIHLCHDCRVNETEQPSSSPDKSQD